LKEEKKEEEKKEEERRALMFEPCGLLDYIDIGVLKF
jgi:hypothetical protein